MIEEMLRFFAENQRLVIAYYCICIDTIFGVLRAVRERKLNSSIGIDGLIRKAAMMITLILFLPADMMININLVGFIPDEALSVIGLSRVGMCDLFAILFIAFECVSILKNMTLCGLPVKRVWNATYTFLKKYTDELPDTDEIDSMEDK